MACCQLKVTLDPHLSQDTVLLRLYSLDLCMEVEIGSPHPQQLIVQACDFGLKGVDSGFAKGILAAKCKQQQGS